MLDNLEEILVASDVGVNTTLKVIKRIEERVSKDKYVGTDELNAILREEIAGLLSETNTGESTEFDIPKNKKPSVVLRLVHLHGRPKFAIGLLQLHEKYLQLLIRRYILLF